MSLVIYLRTLQIDLFYGGHPKMTIFQHEWKYKIAHPSCVWTELLEDTLSMAPTALRPNALNFTQLASLAANAVVPSAGKTFALHNLAFDHVLDNAGSQTFDGNEILAWSLNVPATQNQQVGSHINLDDSQYCINSILVDIPWLPINRRRYRLYPSSFINRR